MRGRGLKVGSYLTIKASSRATPVDSAEAADLDVTAAELARLDAAAPRGATAGACYGDFHMRMLDH